MKLLNKIKWVAALAFILYSCQKDISQENSYGSRCGTVIAKGGTQNTRTIDVDFAGAVVRIELGLLQFGAIAIGDTYCK